MINTKKLNDFINSKNGLHYIDICGFINNAKYDELDESEAEEIFAENYAGNSEWKKNFREVWASGKADPATTATEYKKEHNLKDQKSIVDEVDFNKNFLAFIKKTKNYKMDFDVRDTSLLKYFFKNDDWIHIVSDKFDECEEAKDCYTLIKAEKPLKKYQFMSLGTVKDALGRRKNDNVKEIRYVLLECDKLGIEYQLAFFYSLIEYKLPVKSITYSGGKSFHCLLKIHPMNDVKEYKHYCEKIHSTFNLLYHHLVDAANKDGVRYSRVPFGYRPDKDKIQTLIWCDMIEADNEKYDFKDTLEQVEKYVSLFNVGAYKMMNDSRNNDASSATAITDCNGHIKFDLGASLKNNKTIEDIFQNNGTYYVKMNGLDLQKINKTDLWTLANPFIDDEIKNIIKEGKDAKHKMVNMDDFYINIKRIGYEVTLKKDDNLYNQYEPGFITKCLDRKVTEIPSEFDKLLNNIADDKCKEWLINHLACHFWLVMHDFKRENRDFVLETIPVFYGKSGTGKNTLLDVIGQAISEKGTRYIGIGHLTDSFNDFYMAGLVNINEAAKGKSERRASKEALKRFSDMYQSVNKKYIEPITILNTAYKCISANESTFGVLDIDSFDRRFQYITGGWQKNGKKEGLLDMKLLNEQKYDFISYLLSYECDFEMACETFDNEAKLEDKRQSLSVTESVALWIYENIQSFEHDAFSQRTILNWYEWSTNDHPNVNPRIFGIELQKLFEKSKQAGKNELTQCWNDNFCYKRGEYIYANPKYVKNGVDKKIESDAEKVLYTI